MEAGFSLNNWPKQAENTSSWHYTLNCQSFSDIGLIFMKVRPILKKIFPCKLNMSPFIGKLSESKLILLQLFKIELRN